MSRLVNWHLPMDEPGLDAKRRLRYLAQVSGSVCEHGRKEPFAQTPWHSLRHFGLEMSLFSGNFCISLGLFSSTLSPDVPHFSLQLVAGPLCFEEGGGAAQQLCREWEVLLCF